MTRVLVELSGESLSLAEAESGAAAEALGGIPRGRHDGPVPLTAVDVPDASVVEFAGRLALARRCLAPRGAGPPRPGQPGESASFRRLGRPTGGSTDPQIRTAATAWKSAGGVIDLDCPLRRFWLLGESGPEVPLYEEVGAVDRRAVAGRRISALPFQRPVGLDPRLARASANLARVSAGSKVVDPFLGTGALLGEAALLGAKVFGVDRDPTMVRGALRNFEHLGVTPEELVVGDAGTTDFSAAGASFDAVLTDPPYGRGSGTGGEEAAALVARVLPRWAGLVKVGGFAVVVVPGGPDPLPTGWRRITHVPVRVHRSLTREFRVFRRDA